MKTRLKLLLLAALSICAGSYYVTHQAPKQQIEVAQQQSITLSSVHGSATITEPVIIDLLNTPAMQRIKNINQGGVCHYAKPDTPPFNRYEHSVDVFLVLRRYGASLEEQIAGLLHDVSHTVFSHVGDMVFRNYSAKSSYQDNIHDWFLKEYGIAEVLERHGYNIDDILHKSGSFVMTEQDLPDLCADRIQYNYHTGYIDGLITKEEVMRGYEHLHYKDGKWFFDNPIDAAKLARISLHETTELWGAAWNLLIYDWTAIALRRALETGETNKDEIHYTVCDTAMWNKLLASQDPMIKYFMYKVVNYPQQFKLVDAAAFYAMYAEDPTRCQNIRYKFRGVNPLVQTEQGLQRLTVVDPDYAAEYVATKAQSQQGWYIIFNAPEERTAEEKELYAQAHELIFAQEGVSETTKTLLT